MDRRTQKRCRYVILTTEAKVLAHLRQRKGLSQRKLGEKLEKSGSWVAQIESGRADFPEGEMLNKYLEVLGPITVKSYREYVRNYRNKTTEKDRLEEAIGRLSEDQSNKALNIINAVLAGAIG